MTQEELTHLLQPETPLELAFLEDERFRTGLVWGTPRYGHPEGAIWRHIIEVNANIDRMRLDVESRKKLRLVTWVHDTFKFCEDKSTPRDWSKHHGVYARNFLANYTDDALLLELVKLHDEAYYIWRLTHLYQNLSEADRRLNMLRQQMGDYWQLYYLFFKCDTCTGDKNPAPLDWFEENMDDIVIKDFS
ncbi:hypothetical protein CEQ90_16100 [Lewinellaceae bacterium SD302]|nr:hypothetical protein CEQ90_16100 [Lewinellaceae bacterium SD302]